VVGYFDLYVVFMLLWVWALVLQRRSGSSVWAGRWQWVIGLTFGLCLILGVLGPYQALTAPPLIIGEPPPPKSLVLRLSLLAPSGAHAVLASGCAWLVGLTIQSLFFPVPDAPPDEVEAA